MSEVVRLGQPRDKMDSGMRINQHGSDRDSNLPFARLLDELISSRSLTLEEVARGIRDSSRSGQISRCSKQSVWEWRRGKYVPDPLHIRLIADYFDIPLEMVVARAEAQRRIQSAEIGIVQASNALLGVSDACDSVLESNEDVQRRQFTRLSTVGLAGLIPGPMDLERLNATLTGMRMDARSLDDFASLAEEVMRRSWSATPQSLLGAVRGHLRSLYDALSWTPADLMSQAQSLVAELALLAGYLALRLERKHEADAHWTVSSQFADMAGNVQLRALLLALQSFRWGSDEGKAARLLDQAVSQLGPKPDPAIAALIFSYRAGNESYLRRGEDCLRDLGTADRYLSRISQPNTGMYVIESIEGETIHVRGQCLLYLDRPKDAATELEELLSRMNESWASWRSMVLADIGASQAHLGNPERACDFLTQALRLARAERSPRQVQRVAERRQDWLDTCDAPVVRHLDEELGAAV